MKRKTHADFYLPDYNIAIEAQRKQHFELPVNMGLTIMR
jgi:hypothetical protein